MPGDILDHWYTGTRVVVLGAAGFIGRWVTRAQSAAGAKVYVVVRDPDAAHSVMADYRFRGELVVLDLLNFHQLATTLRQIGPAIIFNLAGYGVDRTERNETMAYQLNARLPGVICDTLAEIPAEKWTGQRLVHVGSALEYGAIRGNLVEDSRPDPMTWYGRSKLAGTDLVTRRCRAHALRGLTARLFTVYGPGEHSGRLLPTLLEAARTGSGVSLTTGEQERDFTYVGDVAEGLLRLGVSAADLGEVVNVATGVLTSVHAFTETAAQELSIPADHLQFGVIPQRAEEMSHAAVATARLRLLTGWTPSISIAEGIRQTRGFEAVRRACSNEY